VSQLAFKSVPIEHRPGLGFQLGLITLFGGALMAFFLPVIGWIAGAGLAIVAFNMMTQKLTRTPCPSCGGQVLLVNHAGAVDCQLCKHHLLAKEGRLYDLDQPLSADAAPAQPAGAAA